MSEVDVLDESEVVFHEQLVEPIQLTLFTPQLASTVTPSPTVTAPSVTSSLPRSRDSTWRANGRGTSSSFYESGTMSASVSRDHSPQRYPRPPPNMIISPAHQRSLSADRTSSSQYNSALKRLVKRLSDVIDVDDDVIKFGGVTSAAACCHDNGTERRRGDQQVSERGDRSRDLMTSEVDHVSRKAASHTEISSPTLTVSSSPTSSMTSSSGSSSRLSRWTATLALFRKKTRRTDNNKQSSTCPPPAAAVQRPLPQQRASLSSCDVMTSDDTCHVHSHLSHSQPLHDSSPPPSRLLATTRGSKLARIIDPLNLRRRPKSSSGDLRMTSMTSSGGEVTSQPQATSRSATRRMRLLLASAYMQGSL